MLLKLAWRNIWRNKRRTWITVASILFSVILAFLMRSMQEGTYDSMIDNVAGSYSGHIQIQQKDYWDQQSLNNSFVYKDSLQQMLKSGQFDNISHFVPRLESFALASSGNKTKGARVLGINPAKETKLMNPEDNLVEGSYLTKNENAILLTEGLAANLHLGIEDTVILLGKGYRGITAAGKYPVKGIIKLPSPELNKRLSFLPLEQAQSLFSMRNRLTSIAMLTQQSDNLKPTVQKLESNMGRNFTTMTWQEINQDLVQAMQADRGSGIIMLLILYIVIGFGIFGTIVMMTMERRREFAILIGIGMHRTKLALVTFMETVMIALTGVFLGLIGGLPVVTYFYFNPIELTGKAAEANKSFGIEPVLPFSMDPDVFLSQMGIVLVLSLVTALYPIIKVLRLKVIQAMQS